tara:strand:+ start:335 stop:562 length:228 start_codon:yes stop_codon:yes gene_type:complete
MSFLIEYYAYVMVSILTVVVILGLFTVYIAVMTLWENRPYFKVRVREEERLRHFKLSDEFLKEINKIQKESGIDE